MTVLCNICATSSSPFANAIILGKYPVQYFLCGNCGFVQTEEPFWLPEAYSEAISRSDIGLVARNISNAKIAKAVIPSFFNPVGRFIDYAGGYGLFVRLMRDSGLDFYRYDKYCKNLFSSDFEADQDVQSQYELLTAFEVFEHLAHPMEEIGRMRTFSQNILFSTELLPASVPKPSEWWYYSLASGQHVAFYTEDALRIIAEKLALNFNTNGRSLHLFSKKKISSMAFKLICRHRVAFLINLFQKQSSLLSADYQMITRNELP